MMGIEVRWDDSAKTVVCFDYQGHWTWTELYAAVDQANTLIESVSYPVAAIIDMTRSAGVPSGAMTHGRAIQQRTHPRVRIQVTVNAGGFVITMVRTFMKLYGALMKTTTPYFVSSIEEARVLIQQKLPQVN